MGRYLDLAKQVPVRTPDSVQETMPSIAPMPCESAVNLSKGKQLQSLARLVNQGAGYVQITAKGEEIYIALTDSKFLQLNQQPGVTVYQAAHLIDLTDDEIRILHSLRTISGPGGSMEIKET